MQKAANVGIKNIMKHCFIGLLISFELKEDSSYFFTFAAKAVHPTYKINKQML